MLNDITEEEIEFILYGDNRASIFGFEISKNEDVELADKSTQTYTQESLTSKSVRFKKKLFISVLSQIDEDIVYKNLNENRNYTRKKSIRLSDHIKFYRTSITASHSQLMDGLEVRVHDFLKKSKLIHLILKKFFGFDF